MLKTLKSRSLLSAAISVALLAPIVHANQERGNVEKAGDVGAYLTPLTALALTYLEDDPDGRWQFLISWSASNLTVQGIKNVVDKRRPNFDIDEQNPEVGANSFPSGHASAAFGGASFIYTRYGKKWGIPAYGVAAFTAYSRVYAEKHFYEDVTAGASIAVLSTLYFVDPINEDFAIVPNVNGDSVGLNVVFTDRIFNIAKNAGREKANEGPKKYSWEWIPVFSNFKTSDKAMPGDDWQFTDTVKDLETSVVRWKYNYSKIHSASFQWSPYEIKSLVNYQGENLHSSYYNHDFTIGYQYNISPDSPLEAKIGANLTAQYVFAEIYNSPTERDVLFKDEDWYFYPALTADLTYKFNNHWSTTVAGSVGKGKDGDIQSMLAQVDYSFNKIWDVGAGYGKYNRDQTDAVGFENMEVDGWFLRFGYNF